MSRGETIKEVREFPRRIKIFFFTIIGLFVFGTLGFVLFKGVTLQSGFILTLETLAFMFQDEVGVVRFLQMFLALVGVFLIWWVLWSIADMTLDGNLKRYINLRYYTFKLKKMKNHIIIVGGGRFGEELASVIHKKSTNLIIVEKDELVYKELKKKGFLVIVGDALDENILKEANIENAKKIIFALPQSEKNLLLTMTAKDLNSKIDVYARADNKSLASKLKKAGAKVVIVPEIVAADELAEEISN